MTDGSLSHVDARLQAPGPKRILSIDGGGVKGVLASGVLEVIEERLRARIDEAAAREAFRLSDYFDLIGGTSTGAIIATWLALGHTAAEVTAMYRDVCPKVFRRELRIPVIQSKFDPTRLKRVIEERLSAVAKANGFAYADMTMDTPLLKTGLALFCKRTDTGSPWMITNNPRAKFWDSERGPWADYWREQAQAEPNEKFNPNAKYPLGDIVRASAAAPMYLEAVDIHVDDDMAGAFVDGAVSTNNNPALQLFLAVTLRGYDVRAGDDARRTPFGFRWETGADRLLLVSVGTGARREAMEFRPWMLTDRVEAVRAVSALTAMIADTVNQNVFALQALSAPAKPVRMDGEVEAMEGMLSGERPLLSFRRIEPRLEVDWLNEHLPDGPPDARTWADRVDDVARMGDLDRASARNLKLLHHVGRVFADSSVADDDFPSAFDLPAMGGAAPPPRVSDADIERTARVAHEALRAWKTSVGQDAGPVWDAAPEWMRQETSESVRRRLENPQASAAEEHDRWARHKIATGWTYGAAKDDAAKTHPMLAPFSDLPEEERKKDALILAVTDALLS